MKTNASNINIKNKRASFDYEFIDTYTAGIVLTGTEIKSIRQGKASLVDTFCFFSRGELWVKNMHIAEYFYGSYNNHAARRDRYPYVYQREGAGKGGHRPCQRKEAIRQAPEPEGERRQADDGPDV